MTTLPLIRTTNPGIYQVCASANTDYVITVPEGALGCVLWFETSASDGTIIGGRIGVDQANTAVTGVTGTDNLLGYHPPMPVEYSFRGTAGPYDTTNRFDRFVHVACKVAGSVVKGSWMFAIDTGE